MFYLTDCAVAVSVQLYHQTLKVVCALHIKYSYVIPYSPKIRSWKLYPYALFFVFVVFN